MNKNKRGFTLTEILVTLTILGIIMLIAIPVYTSISNKFKNDYYEKTKETVLATSKTYFEDNKVARPTEILHSEIVGLDVLTKNKYIDKVYKYNSDAECNGYSVIIKDKKDYIYQTCLECNTDYKTDTSTTLGDYCNGAWKNNDNIVYDYGTESKAYIYYKSDKTKLKQKLETTKKINKYKSGTYNADNLLKSVKYEGDKFYPDDFEKVNLNSIGTYNVKYKIPGENEKKRDVEVYRHEQPTVKGYTGTDFTKPAHITDDLIPIRNNKITLSNTNKYFNSATNSKFIKYQYNIYDNWVDACSTETCESSSPSGNVKFRLVGQNQSKDIDGNLIDSSLEYGEEIEVKIHPAVKVNFDSNGGTVCNPMWAVYGYTYGTLPTSTKTGYTLAWKGSNAYGNSVNVTEGTSVMLQTDHKLTASWTPKTYNVYLDNQGGSGNLAQRNVTVTYNQGMPQIVNPPIKTSYKFGGFYSEKNGGGTQYYNSDGTSANKWTTDGGGTLYAKWIPEDYNISYVLNCGTSGTYAPTNAEFDKSIQISNPINKFTLTFNENNTGATISKTSVDGTATFSGWTSSTIKGLYQYAYTGTAAAFTNTLWSGALTTNQYFKNLRLGTTEAVVLTANWKKQSLNLPTITRSNFTCGWAKASTATTIDLASGGNTNAYSCNSTLYGVCPYDITYYKNSGSGSTAITGTMNKTYCVTGKQCTLRSNAFKRGGYEFRGWATTKTGSVQYNDNYNTCKNGTCDDLGTKSLYAVWAPLTYTIIFDKQDGTGGTNSINVVFDKTVPTIVPPTRSGYTFLGYYSGTSDSSDRYYKANGVGSITYDTLQNITVYAKWKKVPEVTLFGTNGVKNSTGEYISYTSGADTDKRIYFNAFIQTNNNTINSVKFKYNSGNDNTKNPIQCEDKGYSHCNETPVPIRYYTYYDTPGTYNITVTVTYNTSYTITKEFTINIVTPSVYTITYDANGGTGAPNSQTKQYGVPLTLSSIIPTKEDWVFENWVTSNGIAYNAGSSYDLNANLNLIALWGSHSHNYEARSSFTNTTFSVARMNRYDSTTGHWCTNESTSSCVPNNDLFAPKYHVACSICGKIYTYSFWCPVHQGAVTGGIGGSVVAICDAEKEAYSSDAVNCIGKTHGWSEVSK